MNKALEVAIIAAVLLVGMLSIRFIAGLFSPYYRLHFISLIVACFSKISEWSGLIMFGERIHSIYLSRITLEEVKSLDKRKQNMIIAKSLLHEIINISDDLDTFREIIGFMDRRCRKMTPTQFDRFHCASIISEHLMEEKNTDDNR